MKALENLNNHSWVYFQIILFFFLVNIVLGKSNLQIDLSLDQKNSVSESTNKVLNNVDSPVLIEAYVSSDLPGQLMAYIDPYVSTLRSIQSQGKDKVELIFINPESAEDIARATQRGIQGISLTQSKQIETTSRKYFFGLYVQYGEESRIIQLIDPQGRVIPNLEYEFLKELRAMLRKDTSSGIAFVEARGTMQFSQPDQKQGYSKDSAWGFKTLLEQEIGKVDMIGLANPVAKKIDTILLTGLPELNEIEIYNLDQFLMRGGNLLFLAKGYDFQIQKGQSNPYMQRFGGRGAPKSLGYGMLREKELTAVNDWLGKYGLHINGEILIDAGSGVIQINDPLQRTPFPQAYPAWTYYSRKKGNIISDEKLIQHTDEMIIPWPASLDIREAAQSKVSFKTLIQSNPDAISTSSQALDFKPLMDFLNQGSSDRVGRPVPIAVHAAGRFRSAFTKENLPDGVNRDDFQEGQAGDSRANLLVFASPYMVSDILLTGQLNFEIFNLNKSFFINALEALQGDDELLAARARIPAMAILEIKEPILQFLFLLFHLFTIPTLLAAFGIIRLMRRNKKQGIIASEDQN